MRRALIFSLCLLLALAPAARAGQVFPPENVAECGPGTHLSWYGDAENNVRCEPNLPVTCQNGLLQQYNGSLRCVTFDVRTVQNTADVSCVLDASGNCHTAKHRIDCPQGYTVISGSCTLGGWSTTKTWDRMDGNGWICAYAQYGMGGLANMLFPISSTVSATCFAFVPTS